MAFEVFLIIASLFVGVAVYREYFYLRHRRPGLRVQVQTVDERIGQCRALATVTNVGRQTERDVQVHIVASGIRNVDIRVEQEASARPRRIVAVDQVLDAAGSDPGAFMFWVSALAPEEVVALAIDSDGLLTSLVVRATLSEISDMYVPDGDQ